VLACLFVCLFVRNVETEHFIHLSEVYIGEGAAAAYGF